MVGLSEWDFLEPMPKPKKPSPAITLSPPTPETDSHEILETIPESPAEEESSLVQVTEGSETESFLSRATI